MLSTKPHGLPLMVSMMMVVMCVIIHLRCKNKSMNEIAKFKFAGNNLHSPNIN